MVVSQNKRHCNGRQQNVRLRNWTLEKGVGGATLTRMKGGCEAGPVGCFFSFAQFEIALACLGGLAWVHAGSQAGFFQEVAPTLVGIGRCLAILVFAHGGFGVLASLNNFDDSSGDVGAHVMADQDVGRFGIVEGQMGSEMRVEKIW